MKKSFSLIELIIVIVVIGIIYNTVNITLKNTSLNQAANQIISHINYTRHLAIIDNKMQYYPINASNKEMNRSKYWFKQWWHIKFTNAGDDIIYYIFSDSPSFDNDAIGTSINEYETEIAKNPLDKTYLTGGNSEDSKTTTTYTNKINTTKQMNLTKYYNIQKIVFNNGYSSSSMGDKGDRIDILFDNYGNVYMDEGSDGDAGDINPYDKVERKPLLETAKITLCQDNNCELNISICISAKIGNIYLCK